MSTFDFVATLTGACQFMPTVEWYEEQGNVNVLFPNAGRHDRPYTEDRALDGERMARHVPFMLFDPRDLECSGSSSIMQTAAVWYFTHYRVSFDFGGVRLAPTWCFDNSLENRWDIGLQEIKDPTNLAWLASIPKIVGDYYIFNPDCLGQKENTLVGAQLAIECGRLEAIPNQKNKWFFGKRLAGKNLRCPLAHSAKWKVDSIRDKLKIVATPLKKTLPKVEFFLRPHAGSSLKVSFMAFDISNPLQWDHRTTAQVDHDFRWHFGYMTSSAQAEVEKRLKGFGKQHRLPVPAPMPDDTGSVPNIQGSNCLIARG